MLQNKFLLCPSTKLSSYLLKISKWKKCAAFWGSQENVNYIRQQYFSFIIKIGLCGKWRKGSLRPGQRLVYRLYVWEKIWVWTLGGVNCEGSQHAGVNICNYCECRWFAERSQEICTFFLCQRPGGGGGWGGWDTEYQREVQVTTSYC